MNDDFMPGEKVAPGIWRITYEPPPPQLPFWRRVLCDLLGVRR